MDLKKMQISTVDPTVSCRKISKLVDSILKKKPKGHELTSSTQIPELETLWQSTAEENVSSGVLAVDGILSLVFSKHMDLNYAITKFLSIVNFSSNLFPPLYGLTKLLVYQQGQETVNGSHQLFQYYKHPFIYILQSRPESWPFIVDSVLETAFGRETVDQGFTVMKPVFCYIFLNPFEMKEHSTMKTIALEKVTSCSKIPSSLLVDFLSQFIPWMQIYNYSQVSEATLFILKVNQVVTNSLQNDLRGLQEKLLLATLSLCYNAVLFGYNPAELLGIAEDIAVALPKDKSGSFTLNTCLVLLSVMMKETSSFILQKILTLGQIIIEKTVLSQYAAAVIIVPLVHLLAEPKLLTLYNNAKNSSVFKLHAHLQGILYNPSENTNNTYDSFSMDFFESFTSETLLSLHCFKFIWKLNMANDNEKIEYLNYVKIIVQKGAAVSDYIFQAIAGMFLMPTENFKLFQACLETLEAIVVSNTILSTKMLPLLLYKQNSKVDPESQLLIVEYLSKTVTHKLAVAPVLNILQIMAKHSMLKAEAINCMVLLWRKQDRCFSYLHNMLIDKDNTISPETQVCETLIAQAAAICQLCKEEPEKFGGEFLGVLSTIIDQPKNEANAPAVALALDSVYYLCKSEVIDLRSTWHALAPKLCKDKRVLIAARMFKLLSLVPELQVNSFEYDKFMHEIASYVWKQISSTLNDLILLCEAYTTLIEFPMECHALKLLPAPAKENLKLPANMSATPFEMNKSPEDVLSYTPGYCFLDLMKSIRNSVVIQGYGKFLQSLVKQEVKDLPRIIYSKRVHSNSKRNTNDALSRVPAVLCTQFEASKRALTTQKNIAVGVLLSYEPPVELQKDGKPAKHSVAAQSRFYEQVLSVLINDVNLDTNDWQRCVLLSSAWAAFMERTYFTFIESRSVELELQKSHGHLKDMPGEISTLMDTAWLWVRDRLLELIKLSKKDVVSSQANSIFAIAGLVRAVNKFYSILDDKGKKLAENSEKHIDHKTFQQQCTESIICALIPNHNPSSKVYSWLLSHMSKPSSSSGALIRGCAAASLCHVVPVLTSAFVDKIPYLCKHMLQNLADRSVALTLFTSIGLGLFIQSLCQDGYVNFESNQVDMILSTAQKLANSCSRSDELKLPPLIALTLTIDALSQNGNPAFKAFIKNVTTEFHERILHEDPNSMEYEALSICTSAMTVSAISGGFIPMKYGEDLLSFFSEKKADMPQCSSSAISLGLLVDSLLKLGYTKGLDLFQQLQKEWLDIITSEKKPTLHRMAALNGICSLFSNGRGLTQVNKNFSTSSTPSGLKDLVQLMFHLLNSTKDTSLQNIACWELGRLFSVHANQQNDSAASFNNYSYLNDRSVLKPIVEFILKDANEEYLRGEAERGHLLVVLNALNQKMDALLPPLDWTAVLTPVLQKINDPELMEAALKVALFQTSGSPSATALITAYSTPPIVHNLPDNCCLMFIKNIARLASSLPAAKFQGFLKAVLYPCFNDEKMFETKGITAVKVILEALPALHSNASTVTVLQEILNTMIDAVINKMHLLKKYLSLLCECLEQLSEESQNLHLTLGENMNKFYPTTVILCHFVKTGKKPLNCLRSCIETSKRASLGEKEKIIAALYDCFLSCTCDTKRDLNNEEKCIAFYLEIVGWMNILIDSESHKQLKSSEEAVIFLFDVCMAILTGCAGFKIGYAVWNQENMSHEFLTQNLSCALSILINNENWSKVFDKIADWLILLKCSSYVSENDKYYIQAAFCVIRNSATFKRTNVWSEILPCPSINID